MFSRMNETSGGSTDSQISDKVRRYLLYECVTGTGGKQKLQLTVVS